MRRRVQQILSDCSVTLLVILSILWIWSSFGGITGSREKYTFAPNNLPGISPVIGRIDSWGFAIGNGRLGLFRQTQSYAYRARPARFVDVRWQWGPTRDAYWEGTWWQRIGFVFDSQARSLAVGIPCWFLLILSALLAIPRLTRRVERDRRSAAGCCTRCGYDLRATPEKCPECGAVPSRAP